MDMGKTDERFLWGSNGNYIRVEEAPTNFIQSDKERPKQQKCTILDWPWHKVSCKAPQNLYDQSTSQRVSINVFRNVDQLKEQKYDGELEMVARSYPLSYLPQTGKG